jgi:hypothetical protein
MSPGYRVPNVHVTKAEIEWLREAERILKGGEASKTVRRKAAAYVGKVAREAERAHAQES